MRYQFWMLARDKITLTFCHDGRVSPGTHCSPKQTRPLIALWKVQATRFLDIIRHLCAHSRITLRGMGCLLPYMGGWELEQLGFALSSSQTFVYCQWTSCVGWSGFSIDSYCFIVIGWQITVNGITWGWGVFLKNHINGFPCHSRSEPPAKCMNRIN